MLSSLRLKKYTNKFELTSGLDSLELCLSKSHFLRFPREISYQYNRLGYRDNEWPFDLTNQLWCLGDSFTQGLGQPFDEIWPQVLERELNQRTINVSMNGASNDWIARRAEYILTNFNPKSIFIVWSYTHRREDPDTSKLDEDRTLNFDVADFDDLQNLKNNIDKVSAADTNLCTIHSIVPRASRLSKKIIAHQFEGLKFFHPPEMVDRARDFHHFGRRTAEMIAKEFSCWQNKIKI
jgi:hypothetical protein